MSGLKILESRFSRKASLDYMIFQYGGKTACVELYYTGVQPGLYVDGFFVKPLCSLHSRCSDKELMTEAAKRTFGIGYAHPFHPLDQRLHYESITSRSLRFRQVRK